MFGDSVRDAHGISFLSCNYCKLSGLKRHALLSPCRWLGRVAVVLAGSSAQGLTNSRLQSSCWPGCVLIRRLDGEKPLPSAFGGGGWGVAEFGSRQWQVWGPSILLTVGWMLSLVLGGFLQFLEAAPHS